MKHGLPFYFINRKKWKQSKSMELYFQSLIIQTIEFSWLQGGTVKNLLFHIQEAHSKQEKVHWKGAKNLQNNFYFKKTARWKKKYLSECRKKRHSETLQATKTNDWYLHDWIWFEFCFDRLDWDFYFWFLIVYILENGWQNNQKRKILR